MLIEVSPSELRAAVVSHRRITASRSVAHWMPNWKEAWPGVLGSLAAPLRVMVAELGVVGLPATVFYAGPKAAVGVYSCPAAAGARSAESAARLALADATEFGPEHNPTVLARLALDRASRTGDAQGPQIHTLAATDPEASVQAATELAGGCGLRVLGVAPADMVALAATVGAALGASRTPGVAVVLRVGSWGCTLAAATDRRLCFVRQISVGTAALVTALAGEIRQPGGAAGLVTLDRRQAGAMLERAGIPAQGEVFDAATGLAADSVLPLMQPVLQRCIVEIKQSLRFGLTEAERAGARLIPLGPGSALPNLVRVIAEQCGLTLAQPEHPPAGSPLSGGAVEDYAAGALRGVELLLPGERALERRLAGIRRGMWIGVGAACTLAAVDGVSAWFGLQQTGAARDRVLSTLAQSSEVVDIGHTLGEREAALRASTRRLEGWMTPGVQWDALLAVLARETPAPIRLSGIEMTFEDHRPECVLRGHAAQTATGDATETIKSYMQRLAASPIVRKCQLGNARRSQEGQAGGQEFEITITLVGLPADLDLAMTLPEGAP